MKKTENDNIEQRIRGLLADYEPGYNEEHWDKMQAKLNFAISNERKVRKITYFKYAASILILFTISFYFYNSRPIKIIENTFDNTNNGIYLADGSTAWLNRSTKFIYPDKFKRNIRNVSLEGEGYFEVMADTTRPFIVNTQNAQITVLGTKFNIEANTAENIEVVSVIEGKVSVTVKSNNQKVILEKGEKSILDKNKLSIKKETFDNLNFLSWQTNKIKFVNTSLDIVAKTLSKHYNKEIALHNKELEKVKLTSTIDNQPLEEALEIITLTTNLEIETRNDTIFLKNN